MLSKFWTLRQYAKQPELCQGPRAFEDEFKALSTEYGYCPVDYRLKVEFYSKRGDARTVVSTLNEMRSALQPTCLRATTEIVAVGGWA